MFIKIIIKRNTIPDATQPRKQAGFRSVTKLNHIQRLGTITYGANKYNLSRVLAFIDFDIRLRTYGSSDKSKQEQGIGKTYVEKPINIQINATAAVKLQMDSPEFPTAKGVTQGDAISQETFTITLEIIIRKLKQTTEAKLYTGNT